MEDNCENPNRLAALRRFALAITVLNILGHTLFGFEQSWSQPLVSLAAAYGTELALELVDARANRRRSILARPVRAQVDFLLSPHITGLACAMLLYANERLLPIAFASATAIASKALIRIPIQNRSRHLFNPSNFGITVTLVLFPWVGIAPPYHFTEHLSAAGDVILPAIIICSGSFLNGRLTHRLPLILSWLATFVVQAELRTLVFDTPLRSALLPMSGVAFILFTFYMITDPATTPRSPRLQIVFGISVAAVYGLLVSVHVVFGLFFSLTAVSAARGALIYVRSLSRTEAKVAEGKPVTAGLWSSRI